MKEHFSKTYIVCSKCAREINSPNYTKHEKACGNNKGKNRKLKKVRGIDFDPNWGYKDGSRKAWNLGLTKETNPELARPNQLGKRWGASLNGHSEEAKKKISEIRIKFLLANPDKVPYLLNHSSKESYPEKYFKEILLANNCIFEQEFQISLYSLDFAFHDSKIDLEIDGEQHYQAKSIERDKKRDLFLESLGWKTIRVRWAKYQKLSFEEKEVFVTNLIKELNTSSSSGSYPV